MDSAPTIPTPEFRKTHPKALWILFFSELWERFSFYGMRALLVLYMVSEALDYEKAQATSVYAAYGALVYASPILGGWLADKVLGFRHSIVLGGSLMALGHFAMAIENEYVFFWALALICLGNGFFKPNISSTVGRLYAPGDPMRDRGFSIFYMGINVGAATAPLICGFLGETYGWHYGFGLAGIGMVVGLIVFIRGQKLLEGRAEPPSIENYKKWNVPIWGLALFLTLPVALLLGNPHIAEIVLFFALGIALLVAAVIGVKQERIGKQRVFLFLILWLFHALFWALFEQAGSSLTLFAKEFTNRDIGGWDFPISWTQFFNPAFIILFAPLFSLIWATTARMKREPNIPAKFALGVIQVGLGYLVLALGTSFLSPEGLVPLAFLVLMYLLHTTGELCLSPVGLSAVTKLAPKANAALFMGIWFLSISGGHTLAGLMAGQTDLGPQLEEASAKYNLEMSEDELTSLNNQLKDAIVLAAVDAAQRDAEKKDKTLTPAELETVRTEALDGAAKVDTEKKVTAKDAIRTNSLEIIEGMVEWKGEQQFSPTLTAHLNGTLDHLVKAIGQTEEKTESAEGAALTGMKMIQSRAKAMLRTGYTSVYRLGGIIAIIAGFVLLLLAPFVNRLGHGVK